MIGCVAKRGTRAFNVLLAVGVLLLLVDIAPTAYPALDAAITFRFDMVSQFRGIDGVSHERSVTIAEKFLVKTSSFRTDKTTTRGG